VRGGSGPGHVHGELRLVVVGFGFEQLDREVLQVWGVEVDDAGFDVVAGVDEGEGVGGAFAEGVGVAGAGFVEDGGDCGERLVFVGAADVLVGFDFSGMRCQFKWFLVCRADLGCSCVTSLLLLAVLLALLQPSLALRVSFASSSFLWSHELAARLLPPF